MKMIKNHYAHILLRKKAHQIADGKNGKRKFNMRLISLLLLIVFMTSSCSTFDDKNTNSKYKEYLEIESIKKNELERIESSKTENLEKMKEIKEIKSIKLQNNNLLKPIKPSPGYAAKLVEAVKRNIKYTSNGVGNQRVELEVKINSDGSLLSRRILISSGNIEWDNIALKAIDDIKFFPKDIDGSVPPIFILGLKPLD